MKISTLLFAAGGLGFAVGFAGAAPANDDMANARLVGPGSYPFDTTTATTDGPNYSCESGNVSLGRDIWYRIDAISAGVVTVDTCGSSFDTTLAVYLGTTADSRIACNDQRPAGGCVGNNLSSVQFEVLANTTYLINLGGYQGAGGTGTIQISGPLAGAQTFTYQGVITNGGVAASGVVDLIFRMFDAEDGGVQIGETQERPGVTLASGVFTVQLNFDGSVPMSDAVFVEASVNGETLTRQRVTSVPRAVQAMSVPWEGITGTVPTVIAPWVKTGADLSYTGGKVGIGIAPAYTLHVQAPTDVRPAAQIQSAAPFGTWFNLSNTSSGGVFWQFISTGSGNGEGAGNLLMGRSTSPGVITPVMTMTFSGNVGIGTTAPSQRLTVAGNVLANNVGVPSSIRFKDHVVPMTDALESLLKIEGVRFDWKPEYAKERGFVRDVGFVAEDVAKVFPEIVLKDADGNVIGMDYSRVTAVAVEAIKQLKLEQEKQVEKLRAEKDREILELKTRLEKLEAAMRK